MSLASAISAILSASAQAQNAAPSPGPAQLEEVVVTAQKREENLQSVPVSIQALDSRKLEELQVSNFDDYVRYLPSVSTQTYGRHERRRWIARGISAARWRVPR
jgi:iron complex outermembrane recepter protein